MEFGFDSSGSGHQSEVFGLLNGRDRSPRYCRPQAGWFAASLGSGGGVVLAGELVEEALDALCMALDAALDHAMSDLKEFISIDASCLLSIDSSALSELLRYQLLAVTRQRRFCFDRASPPVVEILDLFDLRPILMSHADLNLPQVDSPEMSSR